MLKQLVTSSASDDLVKELLELSGGLPSVLGTCHQDEKSAFPVFEFLEKVGDQFEGYVQTICVPSCTPHLTQRQKGNGLCYTSGHNLQCSGSSPSNLCLWISPRDTRSKLAC